ncbi:MAG TPA: hypothetical protein VK116_11320, partial [Planctomycetota bacterium]|nr:hypothetical protein [Planctomycetota bacterium]
MSADARNPLSVLWEPQPQAEAALTERLDAFLRRSPRASRLAERLRAETGTRVFDWLDAIVAPEADSWHERLAEVGFVPADEPRGDLLRLLRHPGGLFPRAGSHDGARTRLYFRVESVGDFLAAWREWEPDEILGDPCSPLRFARIETTDETELWLVERHGLRGFELPPQDPARDIEAARVHEMFRRRRRVFERDEEGFEWTRALIDQAIGRIGADRACDVFFAAEREYWERRNHAARVQRRRQDRLGLGWANHDHHTYRSSRERFTDLIAILERMGFELRERFYAGAEAGWGAQVLEQPRAGIVVFADVDLSPDELAGDFAHEPLSPRTELGTVGLWCALHGDSLLQAGMHHLECQFDFDLLREQLEREHGVKTMKPFTDFPFLRQAFTAGERWPVDPARI